MPPSKTTTRSLVAAMKSRSGMNFRGYRGAESRESRGVGGMPTPPEPPELAAHPQPPPEVTGVEGLGDAADQAAAGPGVREPGRLALAAEPGRHDRLRAAVLLDPVLAVAEADPRLLPAAHRHVHRQVVDAHVV